MKIPSKASYVHDWEINGETWRVKLVHRMPKGFAGHGGVCCHETKTISLKHNLSEVDSFDIFLHEKIHAHFPDIKHENVYRLQNIFLETWINL